METRQSPTNKVFFFLSTFPIQLIYLVNSLFHCLLITFLVIDVGRISF